MALESGDIHRIHRQSLSEAVLQQIENMILSGKIAPGERLNETRLSSLLGVSRGPIREACRHLLSRGLLEMHANRGMSVREVRDGEVEELFDIRAALDALAGSKAAERIGENGIAELRNWLARMAEQVEANDAEAYYRTNIEFHMAIVRITANSHLLSLYEGICKQTSLFRRVMLSLPERLSDSLDRHRRIVEALERRDGSVAARLLHDHIMDAKKALLDAMRRQKGLSPL